MTEQYTIRTNPAGVVYFDLLNWVGSHAARVGFTVSVNRELSARAKTLLREFEARGADRREVTEWPGTALESGKAILYSLPAPSNMDIVLGAASDLFSWQEPDLPEDLFFLRDDGTPMLTSIAHEADAYLSLKPDEFGELNRLHPEVAALLDRESASPNYR